MSFDQREWVNDLVTGAITGVWGGLVAAMFVPDPPYLDLMTAGGIGGLVTGMTVLPLKWLLNRRPGETDRTMSTPRDPNGTDQDSSSGDVKPETEE